MKPKRQSSYIFRINKKTHSTVYGGQLIVDAMCRRFGIWKKLANARAFNSCGDKTFGFTPEMLAAQVIFTFTSGGTGLSHLDRLRNDPVMVETVGLNPMADSGTVVRWLETQTPASVAELRAINTGLVRSVLQASLSALCARVRKHGILHVIYEDAPLKASQCAGMPPDTERLPALSQYVLWAGPFMLERGTETTETTCGGMQELIVRHRHVWEGVASHFIADTEKTETRMRNVRKAGFAQWSVHNPKWGESLGGKVARIPENEWTAKKPAIPGITEDYASFYYSLEGAPFSQNFAVSRKKRNDCGGAPWRYTVLACESDSPRTPEAVFACHRARGAEAGEAPCGMIPYLGELGFLHPPCQTPAAGQAFYALALIAWNIVMAVKVLEMPDEAQAWQMGDIIHNLLHIPATHVKHANRSFLKLNLASHPYQAWWMALFVKLAPNIVRLRTSPLVVAGVRENVPE